MYSSELYKLQTTYKKEKKENPLTKKGGGILRARPYFISETNSWEGFKPYPFIQNPTENSEVYWS